MDPLLLVIITFGLTFVVTASLAQGFTITPDALKGALRGHSQLNVMLLISNFIVLPALLLGIASLLPFENQVKMGIVVLSITAGSPFIPWLVAQGKGDLGYSVAVSFCLLIATLLVIPWALPLLLNLLDTGASPSVWTVAWPLLLFIVVPLVVGIICRARYPQVVQQVAPWLGPVSVTFLLVHVSLYIGYSWDDLITVAGDAQLLFVLVFPLAGMLIGYVLSPPYVLSPVPAAHPQRGHKIVSEVAVAEQNTSAVICCLLVPLGNYLVAGDYGLLGAITTMVVVMIVMLELGKMVHVVQPTATPAAATVTPAATPAAAPAATPAATSAATPAASPTTTTKTSSSTPAG